MPAGGESALRGVGAEALVVCQEEPAVDGAVAEMLALSAVDRGCGSGAEVDDGLGVGVLGPDQGVGVGFAPQDSTIRPLRVGDCVARLVRVGRE